MKINCPNSQCSNYQNSLFIIKDGKFKRRNDSRQIQRFRCKICNKRFSRATFTLEMYQKKRRVNYPLFQLLASGVSLRRAAIILGISRHTAEKKFKYLGEKSRRKNIKFRQSLQKNKIGQMQFDDLITKESSKLKPLSVTIAVDSKQRTILGARVCVIPSFGHLARLSRRKYGYRKCRHKEALRELFDSLKPILSPFCEIKSDEHKKYPEFVRRYFPKANYERFKSERGCIAGQGELKKVKFDPLFVINHTCAMMRANINRLVRKTWCTTKSIARLQDHLEIFIHFFNEKLIKDIKVTPI
jgi:transposase-like protein